MRSIIHVAWALLAFVAVANPCWGQRGIPIPRFVPSPAPIHFHPVVPHGGHQNGSGGDVDPLAVIAGIVAVAGAIVAGVFGVRAWKNRTVAYLRITDTPPGEAPEDIRRAWVGLELSLRRGETEPQQIQTVGVLSQHDAQIIPGYVVDGPKAVQCLASQAPEAAAWWRENAPHVVAPGYRLFFPAWVCERVGW